MSAEGKVETHDTLLWLLSLSKTLLSTRELDRLIELCAQVFIDATEAERVVVLLKQGSELVPATSLTKAGGEVPVDARISSLSAEVAMGGSPVFTTDTVGDRRMARASVLDLGLQMVVCVPLRGPSGIVGVIYADGKTTIDHVFTTTNKSRLEALADHAGAAIENARYFEGVTRDAETQLVNGAYFRSLLGSHSPTVAASVVVAEISNLAILEGEHSEQVLHDMWRTFGDSTRAHLQRPEFAGRLSRNEVGLLMVHRGSDSIVERVEEWIRHNTALAVRAQQREGVSADSAVWVRLALHAGVCPLKRHLDVDVAIEAARRAIVREATVHETSEQLQPLPRP